IVLPEIEGTVAVRDVVEALAVRSPGGPAAFSAIAGDLNAAAILAIEHPDLTCTGSTVTLSPPGFAFAHEEDALAIRGDRALGGVIVQQHFLSAAVVHIQHRQTGRGTGRPGEIACDADEEALAIG